MANNKIFTILLFFLFIGINGYATEPNKLGEGVFSALQQTIDQNERNKETGVKDRNFLISVDASNPSVFAAECPNPQLGFINEYESSNELVEVWENLEIKLCDFNSQNIWNLNHYGIALFFPLNSEDSELDPILNDFINLSDQDNIVSYLTNEVNGQKRKSFGSLYSNIQNKLDTDLRLPNPDGELMVTITSIFPISNHKDEIEFHTVTNTVFIQSATMEQNFAPFIEFVDKNNTFLDVAEVELKHYEKFYRRLFGYTYYFENIDGLPNNSECGSLLDFKFSNSSSKQAKYEQIINCYCDYYIVSDTEDLTLDEKEIEFLYILMNFKKDLFALTLDEWVCQPGLESEEWTNWESGVFPDFVNNHGTSDWKDYLVDKITSSQSTNPYIVQYIMLYFNSTTFADHAQLTAIQRYDLISRIAEDVDPNDPSIQIFEYDPLDIVYTLLKSLYDFDSGDIEEFYPYIKDNKVFFDWYWNKAFINFTGNLARKKEFCNVLTDIAISQFTPPTDEGSFIEQFENKGKLFTWKIFDGTPICGYHTYSGAEYNEIDHKSTFNYKFITNVSSPTSNGYYNAGINTVGGGYNLITSTWSDPYSVSLHPFELVAVVSGDHAKWTSDCGSLISPNCEFKMKLIPAFVLSFYIAEAQSSENWEQFITGVQVVSVFASAYAMATATTLAGTVFYGSVLLADIGVLVIPPTYASVIQDQDIYDVNEINIRVQRVENVTNIAAGVLGAVDLLKAIKAVAAYLHLRNLGADDLEQMNKALLMIKHSSQIDASDPAKICDLFQLSPHARSIIMQLNDQPSHVKILLASWIDMKPALGNSARTLFDYKFLAKTFFDSDLTKALLKLDEVKFLKFLDDFENFDDFVINPSLIKVWEGLFPSEILRKNFDALYEGKYLLGKGFTKSDLNGFAVHVDDVFPETKIVLTDRISSGSAYQNLIHTDHQLQAILLRAKSLNLSTDVIDDFLLVSCRTVKPIPAANLMAQMDNWVNIVLVRGYPYRFSSLTEYQLFGVQLKNKYSSIGVDIGDVRVQGSAVRSPDANDVDIVAMISQSDFDSFMKTGWNGRVKKKNSAGILVEVEMNNMTHQDLLDLSIDITQNPTLYNGQAKAGFNYNFQNKIIKATPNKNVIPDFKTKLVEIQTQFPNLNIENITIQVPGAEFDLKPFLNL